MTPSLVNNDVSTVDELPYLLICIFLFLSTLSSDQRPQASNVSPGKRGKFSPFAVRGGTRGRGRGSEPVSFDRNGRRKRRNSDSSEASEASTKVKGGKGKRNKNKNDPNYGDNPNQIPLGEFSY